MLCLCWLFTFMRLYWDQDRLLCALLYLPSLWSLSLSAPHPTPEHCGFADGHHQDLPLLSNGKCDFAQGWGVKRNQFERIHLRNRQGTRWRKCYLPKVPELRGRQPSLMELCPWRCSRLAFSKSSACTPGGGWWQEGQGLRDQYHTCDAEILGKVTSIFISLFLL